VYAPIRFRWIIPWPGIAVAILLACSMLGAGTTAAGTKHAAAETVRPTAVAVRPFPVFDGLLYLGKPDLRPQGLVPIVWIGDLWGPGVSKETVDEVRVRSEFERIRNSGGLYYLDIENWPVLSVSGTTRRQNIEKLTRVIDLARHAAPHAQLGFYGILPGITYWPLFRHDAEYRDWLDGNRALDPLAGHVDAIFPSLYTYYDDLEGWKNYARQTLSEARRYGKPVYVFLWPQFHDSNPDLRGKELPRAFWRSELDLCAQMADGIVLWGGWQGQWDERASWWQEVLAFMKTLENGSGAVDPAGS